jgi:hypothetical protein
MRDFVKIDEVGVGRYWRWVKPRELEWSQDVRHRAHRKTTNDNTVLVFDLT